MLRQNAIELAFGSQPLTSSKWSLGPRLADSPRALSENSSFSNVRSHTTLDCITSASTQNNPENAWGRSNNLSRPPSPLHNHRALTVIASATRAHLGAMENTRNSSVDFPNSSQPLPDQNDQLNPKLESNDSLSDHKPHSDQIHQCESNASLDQQTSGDKQAQLDHAPRNGLIIPSSQPPRPVQSSKPDQGAQLGESSVTERKIRPDPQPQQTASVRPDAQQSVSIPHRSSENQNNRAHRRSSNNLDSHNHYNNSAQDTTPQDQLVNREFAQRGRSRGRGRPRGNYPRSRGSREVYGRYDPRSQNAGSSLQLQGISNNAKNINHVSTWEQYVNSKAIDRREIGLPNANSGQNQAWDKIDNDALWAQDEENLHRGYTASGKWPSLEDSKQRHNKHNWNGNSTPQVTGDDAWDNHYVFSGEDWKSQVQSQEAQDDWGDTRPPGLGENRHELADWDGSWAPAPADWGDREAFHPDVVQSVLAWRGTVEPSNVLIESEGLYNTPKDSDIADPRWKPLELDGIPMDEWWEQHCSRTDSDLGISKEPFWNHYLMESPPVLQALKHDEAPIDSSDNDMSKVLYQTPHNMIREKHDAHLRRKHKRKEKYELTRLLNANIPQYEPEPNPYIPDANIFLRPALSRDMTQITTLYNHFIKNTTCCPEHDPLSVSDVRERWQDGMDRRLPFIVAVDRSSKGNRRGGRNGDNLPHYEHIVGFAYADDYNDNRGMYRYAVEVDMFVQPGLQRQGVGRCLFDKLLHVLDPHYDPRGGYDFLSDDTNYVTGGARTVGSIFINVPWAEGDKNRVDWIQNWLKQFGFFQAGHYPSMGRKLNST